MVPSDFLSRQQGDSDPHKIIPILFNMKEILKQNYQSYVKDTFLVQTRSQNKAEGVKLPTVHGATKPLVPHEILEKQLTRTRKEEVRREVKPILDDTSILIEAEPNQNLSCNHKMSQ